MKVYAILILYKSEVQSGVGGGSSAATVRVLKRATDLSQFSIFERSAVDEFITFTAKILTERTGADVGRQSIKEANYMVHVRKRRENVTAVCVTDQEYSDRVAHSLLDKVLDDFLGQIPAETYSQIDTIKDGNMAGFDGVLDNYLKLYQDPSKADGLSKIEAELDETKVILHNTIAAVLERGEKLDDLVERSEGLSMGSKMFYKTARKTNSCCGGYF